MRNCAALCLALWLLVFGPAGAGMAQAVSAFPPEARYSVAFSPGKESLSLILQSINGAEESIMVAGYSFSSRPVAEALLEAHGRGIAVRVVLDAKANSNSYTAANFLANHGIPVRLNGNYAIMHHKFMVIDGRHVETGSFNYSAAAVSKNAENVLILWDVPELAEKYAHEWQRLWEEAQGLPPKY